METYSLSVLEDSQLFSVPARAGKETNLDPGTASQSFVKLSLKSTEKPKLSGNMTAGIGLLGNFKRRFPQE